MKQTLFHGGTEIIRQPEIREPNRTLDFGRGFYLTTSPEQAERWVRNRLRNGVTGGYVNVYAFDRDSLPGDIVLKEFTEADEAWVDFVMNNRLTPGFEHGYDIVSGPVADDRVYAQFSLFEGGIISRQTLIHELKAYKLVDQYLFHTERALECLKYIDHYPVGADDGDNE